MKASETRTHPDQTKITLLTITLPNGKVQAFQVWEQTGRVYADGTTQFWPADEFAAGLDKMRAAGATIVESVAYAWE